MTAKQYSDLKYLVGQLDGIAFVLKRGNDTSKKISEGIAQIEGNIRLLADEMWEADNAGA